MKNVNSVIRSHIERGVNSFKNLTQDQKREVVAYELISNHSDGLDMIGNHEGREITQHIFDWYIKKSISAKDALTQLLDDIIKRYETNLDEMFDDEFEKYIEDSVDNAMIYRSAENSGIPNAHYYI